MASETLLPTETAVCSLCSGLHVGLPDVLFLLLPLAMGKDDGLRAEQAEPPTPDLAAFPIAPEYRANRGRCHLLRRRFSHKGLLEESGQNTALTRRGLLVLQLS
jgi:hypothetical protein